jgi:hypothetical protein
MRGQETEVARSNLGAADSQIAVERACDGKFPGRCEVAPFSEIPFLNLEQLVFD